jgi:hypothetical protein
MHSRWTQRLPVMDITGVQIIWWLEGPHSTFGRLGQIRSQRSIMLCASRLGQSPLSCSLHFIMLALRPYFSMSLWTL